jgi:putative transposase
MKPLPWPSASDIDSLDRYLRLGRTGSEVVKIGGEAHYLCRAVDHEGEVLESFVTKTREKVAALIFLEKAMRRYGPLKALVTDGLRSYGATMREIGNVERREVGRHLNNRAANSHLPFRRRERAMLRFRRMSSLQRFCSTHASIQNHFNVQRHLKTRSILTYFPYGAPSKLRQPSGY